MASRRFSQAISEGDGISVIVAVQDAAGARDAQSQGAEAILVREAFDGLRDATELPILWVSEGPPDARASAPLSWEEVPDCDPARFTLTTMRKRIDAVGDLTAGMWRRKVSLASRLGAFG